MILFGVLVLVFAFVIYGLRDAAEGIADMRATSRYSTALRISSLSGVILVVLGIIPLIRH